MASPQKNPVNNPEIEARIEARIDAIDAAKLIAGGTIVNSPDDKHTSVMKLGREINPDNEQSLRTMINSFAGIKTDEYAATHGDAYTVLRRETDGTTSIEGTTKVLADMKREADVSLNQKRIHPTLKALAHTPMEKAEDIILNAVAGGDHWHPEPGTTPVSIMHPVALETEAVGYGETRTNLVTLVRDETRKAKEAGLKNVVEPEIMNLSSRENGNTTKIVVDSRVADQMMERMQSEREIIEAAVKQKLSESRGQGAKAQR